MHVKIGYPDAQHEKDILRLVRDENAASNQSIPVGHQVLDQKQVFTARQEILQVHVADAVEDYIVRLVTATRETSHNTNLSRWIAFGASPRGTLAIDACARACAWLQERDYVTPGDVQAVLHDTLRHRVLLSYEAEADAVTADQVIDSLLDQVSAP